MNRITAVAGVVVKELYRRKDFYVLFVLTALITLSLGAINFFNEARIARYLKEICLLLIWISGLFIALATAARQIPAEKENRTIFPLLAKPLSRGELITGKFLGCWLACGICLLVFYLFFGVITATREQTWPFWQYLQALVFHWFLLGIVIAVALFGSLIFAAPSSNGTICFVATLAILFLGRHLHGVAGTMDEPVRSLLVALYFVIPHLEFFDLRDLVIHNVPPVNWVAWFLALIYGLGYMGFFLILAWLQFRHKALNTA